MSWDYKSAARPCGHEIVRERYVLDSYDFRTLHYAKDPTINMRAPINGVSAVRVLFKDVLVSQDDPNYGYSLLGDPERIQEGFTFFKLVFNKALRLTRPIIEVSYITRQEFCLQCGGTGTVNDWTVSQSGALAHIHDVEKMAQQSLKYILTSKNPFSPNLVCHLKDYLGKKFNFDVSSQDIATEITRVLQTYQQIQGAQKTVQTMSPGEILRDISGVTVREDPSNPNLILVSIVVTAYGSPKQFPINMALQRQSS